MSAAMTNANIPGYWFCPLKKKYFKIQSGAAAAPADSPHNAANVKKRRLQQEKTDQARKRQEKLSQHIKRAPVLADPMTGGRLLHEAGVVYDPELPNKCWLAGLQDRGQVALGNAQGPSLDCMLVNGDDTKSGMAMVFGVPHGARQARACYVPTDAQDFINYAADPLRRRSRMFHLHPEPWWSEDITSISYHKGSHNILQTSKVPNQNNAHMTVYQPILSDDYTLAHDFTNEPAPQPAWLLGEHRGRVSFTLPEPNTHLTAARVAPMAHGSTTLNALVASNRGLLRIFGPHFAWLTPLTSRHNFDNLRVDALSVDWHPTNPNIAFAGDRGRRFLHTDMRGPTHQGWTFYRHRSSVAHIRALDDFQILAAGPQNAMAVYDVRRMRSAGPRGEAAPVCTMHDYVNSAHVNIGLDVTKLHGGEAVVAAASSLGTVEVYSLRTGNRLRAGALDDLAVKDQVFKCLQWETMPGEKDPSLWVGVGASVKKYSFGLAQGEDAFS